MKNDKDTIRKKTGSTVKSQVKSQELLKKRQLLIVRKAAKLFIKKGYSQTTMREISKATGVNLGNLYNFIDSKEDILCLIFSTFHDPGTEWFQQSGVLAIEDPVEQLRVAVHRMLEMIHASKNDILMMYRETHVLPPKFLKLVLGKENVLVRFFEGIIKRGVEKGVFKAKDPFFSANMLVYQLSLYPMRSWNLKQYTEEALLGLTEAAILEGIVKPGCDEGV